MHSFIHSMITCHVSYDYIEMTKAHSLPVEEGKLHLLSTKYLPGLMLTERNNSLPLVAKSAVSYVGKLEKFQRGELKQQKASGEKGWLQKDSFTQSAAFTECPLRAGCNATHGHYNGTFNLYNHQARLPLSLYHRPGSRGSEGRQPV